MGTRRIDGTTGTKALGNQGKLTRPETELEHIQYVATRGSMKRVSLMSVTRFIIYEQLRDVVL